MSPGQRPVGFAGVGQQYRHGLARGNVHLALDLPDAEDELHHPLHLALGAVVDQRGPAGGEGLVHDGVARLTREGGNALPDLFSDEGHDRMCQPQKGFQHPHQRAAGAPTG